MTRLTLSALALILLAGCGVAGDPLPPEGAVQPVAVRGTDLTPEKGGL